MTGYNYAITVPAGTPLKNPVIEEHGIKPGVINNVHIEFPSGCNRFVYVQVWMGETPLIPDDKGEWLRGNGHLYSYLMDFQVEPMQGKLKIICASPDATLDHFINVGLGHSALPKPDTLTPAMYHLATRIDQLITIIQNSQSASNTLLGELIRRLTGGKR